MLEAWLVLAGSVLCVCIFCAQPRKPWEERREFERHLVAGGRIRDRSCLDHLHVVSPGVQLNSAAQRKSRDLVELILVEGRSRRQQGTQTGDLSFLIGEAIPQMRGE